MKPDLRAHIDDAKARVKVSGVVGRDVPLDGRKAIRCPFGGHEDSHPSFSVSDAKGRWKCWGCGRGGDVLDWLMQRRGLSFRDAVDEIGKLAGLPPYAWNGLGAGDVEDARGIHEEEQYKLLTLDLVRTIDVKQEAAKYYATSLFANRHEPLSYARNGRTVETTVLGYQTETRGHSEESLRNALVGWADGKLLDHLHRVFDEQHGAKLVTLAALASGLVKRGKGGALRDFFRRGMYTYPVVDAAGKVVTITGKHPDDEIPNYQLPKCVTLTVKNAAKKVAIEFPVWGAGWYFLNQVVLNSDDLLIVEGEDDVGSVRDRGDHEVVVGTRGLPGAEQLAELAKRRRGKRSFLAFDNDEAGVEYTWLVAEALAGADYDVRAVTLPAKHKDIDDALCAVGRESGAALVRRLTAEAKPILDRLADHLRQDRPAAEKNDAATRFARIVLKQPPLVQDEWHKRLRETLGASAGAIRKVFRAAERSARKDRKAREEGPAPKKR